ncbi:MULTISPECIES: ferritin family protein [unclassified Oceanispirochaeta]|uniref:ferritin family protein n=1 Tax=unclassified Oceanispirochaeta TaxID=2635722 RepID=UPI000E092130|nr:ferritin family protein [Oceanispirochaeta sp. M1]MBF9016414.1 metallophosphoesterase [Oceanispirochaeta sp. M2]NPD72876.1 hypothetical protein [Oceanispirochaeta sp. M1]RDG31453.1 hypothetical protein DV872_12275 [Oceanispirochaeta sp. M1]
MSNTIRKGLLKMEKTVLHLPRAERINLIGDPGCDGLGAGIMTVFAKALSSTEADHSIIIGDMVPFGSKKIYQNVCDFTQSMAEHPVTCLKGNHDTEYYDEFFGSPNYALASEDLLIIVLDNAARVFTPEALDFCKKVLHKEDAENIIFAFHYPPPNPVAGNSINPSEWEDFRAIYGVYMDKILYFVSGHVHSMVETEIDGIPVLITGGAGARIEQMNPEYDESYIRHHIFQIFREDGGKFTHRIIYLDDIPYTRELKDRKLLEMLETAYHNEIEAHFKYKMMGVNAKEQGWEGLALLFKALSDSEFHHAMNHFEVLGKGKTILENLKKSIDGENYEINEMYKSYMEYAEAQGHSLARYTFQDARDAEKVHSSLLSKALEAVEEEKDITLSSYYTCTSCGYTFETENKPVRCPVCGAPDDKIEPVLPL